MNDNQVYVTKCAWCGGELRLLKDPEGKAYHHDCWVKMKEISSG